MFISLGFVYITEIKDKFILQNIMQAYISLKTKLNHIIIYHLSVKLKKKSFNDIILLNVKLLYNLIETKK